MKSRFWIHCIFSLLLLTALIGCGSEEKSLSTQSARPALLASPMLVFDFGTRVIDDPTSVQIQIINSGELPATQMEGAFTISAFQYTGGNYPGTSGTCEESLSVKTSCLLDVTFQPKYAGSFQENLHLNYHNGITFTEATSPVFSGKGVSNIGP